MDTETSSVYKFFSHLGEKLGKISVNQSVVLAFATAIGIGSVFLYYFEGGAIHYIDALYISASSICITGLTPLPLSEFQRASQITILLLIQAGGIGIVAVSILVGSLILRGMSRNTKIIQFVSGVIDEAKEETTPQDKTETPPPTSTTNRISPEEQTFNKIKSYLKISLTMEALGAVFLYFRFENHNQSDPGFLALFTSVSAFNNAGFSLLDDLALFREDSIALFGISLLIILGGIGFPVIIFFEKSILRIMAQFGHYLQDIEEGWMLRLIMKYQWLNVDWIFRPTQFLTRITSKAEVKLIEYNANLGGASHSIQSSMLVYGTSVLLLLGTVGIFIIEYNNVDSIGDLALWDKFANAFFASVCSRTAGFNTFHFGNIQDATLVIVCMLMFIGGGPQGTAGGIKITTFFILMLYLRNVVSPKREVVAFNQNLSKNSVAMSTRIYFMATSLLAVVFLILVFLNGNEHSLEVIFFELLSAFSTVGFSLGLTSQLGDWEKLVYILVMFVGRIGVFTVLMAITGKSTPSIGNDDGVKIQVG